MAKFDEKTGERLDPETDPVTTTPAKPEKPKTTDDAGKGAKDK